MRNITFPRRHAFYDPLNKLICTVNDTLPGLSSAHRHRGRRLIWDQGNATYEATFADVVPRLDPSAIRSVWKRHEWIGWGPLDKNTGGAFGMCKKLQAEGFGQHFLESPRYSVLHVLDCVDDASGYILSTVQDTCCGWTETVCTRPMVCHVRPLRLPNYQKQVLRTHGCHQNGTQKFPLLVQFLRHPLQLPLHSQPHIKLHPHAQPLHLWLSV